MAGSCVHRNEPAGYVGGGKFSWIAERLSAPQEGLCSMDLVRFEELLDLRHKSKYPTLSDTSISLTSEVCANILLLLMEMKTCACGVPSKGTTTTFSDKFVN